jgi:PAS domain S-box-containing protein
MERFKTNDTAHRALLDGVDVGITLIDSDLNIVTVNRKQTEIIGRSPGDLIGKKCYREFEGREEICPGCPGLLAMASGRPADREAAGQRLDGSEYAVRL